MRSIVTYFSSNLNLTIEFLPSVLAECVMFGGVGWWVALMLVPHCLGRATIENNGYQDVLVAISPEVGVKN